MLYQIRFCIAINYQREKAFKTYEVELEIIGKSFSAGPWGPGGGNMGGDGGYQGKQLLSFSVGGVINPGSGNRNMSNHCL